MLGGPDPDMSPSSGPPRHIKDPSIMQTIDFYICMKLSIVRTAALFDRTRDMFVDNTRDTKLSMIKITTDQIRAAGS